MAKLKSSDTLSLDKSKQKKVVKQTKKLKKKIQDGKVSIKKHRNLFKAKDVQNRGLVYIGHIPHGFYENEMKKYFDQFGAVTNVKVCRSNKSGNSKGFGYVEFSHSEVAKIAAETMNNYLMFKKRIIAEYVPTEKRPKDLFKGRSSTVKRYSSKVRLQKQRAANLKLDEKTHLKRSSSRLSRLNKKLQILEKSGIDCDFKPVDVPQNVNLDTGAEISSEETVEQVAYTFEPDAYDSDIEVKVPVTSRTPAKTTKKGSLVQDPVNLIATPKKSLKSDSKSPKTTSKRKSAPLKKTPKKVVSDDSMAEEKKIKSVSKPSSEQLTPRQSTRRKSIAQVESLLTPKAKTPKKLSSKTSNDTPKKSPKQTPKQKILKRKSIR